MFSNMFLLTPLASTFASAASIPQPMSMWVVGPDGPRYHLRDVKIDAAQVNSTLAELERCDVATVNCWSNLNSDRAPAVNPTSYAIGVSALKNHCIQTQSISAGQHLYVLGRSLEWFKGMLA